MNVIGCGFISGEAMDVWMLSVEKQVVIPPRPNFSAGLAALFSTYYNFNLEYQEKASCTLEFIQR